MPMHLITLRDGPCQLSRAGDVEAESVVRVESDSRQVHAARPGMRVTASRAGARPANRFLGEVCANEGPHDSAGQDEEVQREASSKSLQS